MTNKDKLLEVLTPLERPFYWIEHFLTVIGDGYLEDGIRVHMVAEDMEESVMYLSNSYVVSLPMIIQEDISKHLESYLGEIKDRKLQLKLTSCVSRVLDKYKALGWIKR